MCRLRAKEDNSESESDSPTIQERREMSRSMSSWTSDYVSLQLSRLRLVYMQALHRPEYTLQACWLKAWHAWLIYEMICYCQTQRVKTRC